MNSDIICEHNPMVEVVPHEDMIIKMSEPSKFQVYFQYWHSFFVVKEPGIKLSKQDSFYGNETEHILTYDPAQIRSLFAPFVSRDLTVCYSIKFWLRYLFSLVYATLLMLALGYSDEMFPDTKMGQKAACNAAFPLQNKNICDTVVILTSAVMEFRFLISFILAGYVGTVVSLWNVKRSNYASLCGNARNVSIKILSILPKEVAKDDQMTSQDLMYLRTTLARWIMLAFELAVLKARGHMDSQEGKDHLIAQNLLFPDEWDALIPGDRHNTVFFWILHQINILHRDKLVNETEMMHLAENIAQMRHQANDLMSQIDRDLPYSYCIICGLLVQINVFFNSSQKGLEWATWLRSGGSDKLFTSPRIWIDMLILLTWNISYVAIYDLSYFLYNPFQGRRIDVAHELIFNGIRKLSTELAAYKIPLPKYLR